MNLTISSPRAPRLATLSDLARGFLSDNDCEVHRRSYYLDTMRQFIKGNLSSSLKYKTASKSSRLNERRKGRNISKAIATIKKNPKDIEASFIYLSLIYQMNEDKARQFEPAFIDARVNFRSGEWQAITLKSIDSNIEGYHLINFDRYNFIYSLHFSMSEPTLVAYYPTLEHMRKRKEVRLRFGKFLTNIKDEIGIESESIIKNYVDAYNSILHARNGWRLDFIDSNDREGWLNIYRDDAHVNSCMSDSDSVKLYAHDRSVLRLAYLTNNDEAVIARCIVREDVKEYIRVYPAPENSTSGKWLQSLLKDKGYAHGSLEGVLIKTYDHDEGGYHAPYIDRGNSSGCQYGSIKNIDGKLFFEIGDNGDYSLTMTNGRTQEDESEDDNSTYCEWCDDYHHEDDTQYHDNLGYSVCDGCANDCGINAINPDGDHDFIHQDDAFYCESDNEYYTREAFDEGVILRDESSGDFYLIEDLIEVFENLFIHKNQVISPIVPYIRSRTRLTNGDLVAHYQYFIDIDEARFLPNGEAIHYTQFDEMIELLNSFKLESEAINA